MGCLSGRCAGGWRACLPHSNCSIGESLVSSTTISALGILILMLAVRVSDASALTPNTSAADSLHLQEIVVTGTTPIPLFDLPRSASIITAQDIESSGAANLAELIARQANVTLTSYTGNEKFSQLDIRGSGDTSASNVLILVDGVRNNLLDLSGADLSLIALQQIERIEIIRGANTVRYGSGAAQGVINIISKKSEPGLKGKSVARYGSYNQTRLSQDISITSQKHSLLLSASYSDSEGYRDHNALRSENYALNWKTTAQDKLSVSLTSRLHRDEFELPGPLARDLVNKNNSIRRTSNPARTSAGSTQDETQLLQISLQPLKDFVLHSNLYYRERRNPFVLSSSTVIPAQLSSVPKDQQDHINTRIKGGELLGSWSPNTLALTVNGGLTYSDNTYSRTDGGEKIEGRIKNQGSVMTRAAYVYSELDARKDLQINFGYRRESSQNQYLKTQLSQDESSADCTRTDYETAAGTLVTIVDNCPLQELALQSVASTWRNEAFEYGFVAKLPHQITIYGGYARTFRNPNVDELALTDPQNSVLIPQQAERFETGVRLQTQSTALSAALFDSRTANEIIFRSDGLTILVNKNFSQPIERRGLELQVNRQYERVSVNANLGYTQAKTPDERRIPLVPRINAALNINWNINSATSLNMNSQYIGDRLDGNSFEQNDYEKLSSYVVTNARINWAIQREHSKPINLYIGSNNLFNEQYFSTSYSEFVYPASERSVYGGISFEI
jgi:iron complex outermembrane receptor protein